MKWFFYQSCRLLCKFHLKKICNRVHYSHRYRLKSKRGQENVSALAIKRWQRGYESAYPQADPSRQTGPAYTRSTNRHIHSWQTSLSQADKPAYPRPTNWLILGQQTDESAYSRPKYRHIPAFHSKKWWPIIKSFFLLSLCFLSPLFLNWFTNLLGFSSFCQFPFFKENILLLG